MILFSGSGFLFIKNLAINNAKSQFTINQVLAMRFLHNAVHLTQILVKESLITFSLILSVRMLGDVNV